MSFWKSKTKTEAISEFEAKLVKFMNKSKKALLDKISEGVWDDEVESELKSAFE